MIVRRKPYGPDVEISEESDELLYALAITPSFRFRCQFGSLLLSVMTHGKEVVDINNHDLLIAMFISISLINLDCISLLLILVDKVLAEKTVQRIPILKTDCRLIQLEADGEYREEESPALPWLR